MHDPAECDDSPSPLARGEPVWLDQNVGLSTRKRFLDLRGLAAWDVQSDPWQLRGYEQGAEIIAWALGERILTPQIADAYELVTGQPLPAED